MYTNSFIRFHLVAVLIILAACKPQPQTKSKVPKLKSLEISYYNGWGERFSVMIDSSQIFFYTDVLNKIEYGLIPDSTFYHIDSLCSVITNDSGIVNNEENCIDCGVIALKIITSSHQKELTQSGEGISPLIGIILNQLEQFIRHSNPKSINGTIFFDTNSKVLSPIRRPTQRFLDMMEQEQKK